MTTALLQYILDAVERIEESINVCGRSIFAVFEKQTPVVGTLLMRYILFEESKCVLESS